MAVPTGGTSKARKARYHARYRLTIKRLDGYPNCGGTKKGHHIRVSCGYYDGKSVVSEGA